MTLYRLHSIVDYWPHRGFRYNQVYVTWFKEQNDLPLDALFQGPLDAYSESQADECFTAEQADALTAYLNTKHQTIVIREPVTLPLPINEPMGVSALAVGGADDFYSLFREDAYALPFKVSGYYRIYGAESYLVVSAAGVTNVSKPGPGAVPEMGAAVNDGGLVF